MRHYAQHPHRNTSRLIAGTQCDGCRCCCIIVRKHLRHTFEEYWCDHKHMVVKPQEVDCSYRSER